MKTFFLSAVFALSFLGTQAQVTDSFIVAGNCDMCKKRIEDAADIKGVKRASWDAKTKMLTINYNPEKVTIKTIEVAIAKAGHDTPDVIADSAAFEKLHDCCHYERLNQVQPKSK
jgi:hypothetical protein